MTISTSTSMCGATNWCGARWLVLAAVLFLFVGGAFNIPVAAWLAPVFLIRYLHLQPALRGLLIGAVAVFATQLFVWKGAIPVPFLWLYVLITFAVFAGNYLPFVLNRILAPKLGGFVSTFVFPLCWVSKEYLVSVFSPYSTIGSAAYTQFDNLALLQIVSITGIYGVTFLIGWFAAVVNWAWEQDFSWEKVNRGVIALVSTLAVVVVFGSARQVITPSSSETVRIASVSVEVDHGDIRSLIATLSTDENDSVRTMMADKVDELFTLTTREAQAGAKLVFWAEMSALLLREDEANVIAKGQAIARKQGIYLVMAFATLIPENMNSDKPKLENKALAIDPSGKILVNYLKSRPVPMEPSLPGDGVVPVFDTPFGRVSLVICFDMDFPILIQQAGQKEVDIMLVPAADWKEIDPWHTYLALVRGIENGMSVIRQVQHGFSAAADHQGNILAAMDHFTTTGDRVMVAQVPKKGINTFYGRAGDVFAWGCFAALACLFAGLFIRKLSPSSTRSDHSSADSLG
jgi:apolipoprotein N-acyltransferase